jgi:hypothetical protein
MSKDTRLAIQGSSRVVKNDFIEIVKGSKVIGTVKATFDLTDLPTEYDDLALRIIESSGRRVMSSRE